MAGFTRITMNDAAIRNLLVGGTGPVVKLVDQADKQVATAARGRIRSNTGALAGSIRDEIRVEGLVVIGRVFSNLPYAWIVHEGRGPVVPKRAKVLAFVPAGGSRTVFTMRSKAVPPYPFLYWAIQTTLPEWTITRVRGQRSGP